MMRFLASILAALVLLTSEAAAQSNPGLRTGQVPTATQWNSYFSAKQDYLGYTPLNPSSIVGLPPIVVTPAAGVVTISCPLCGTTPATVSGSANAITLTPTGVSPPPPSAGSSYLFKAVSSNTAATTIIIGVTGPYPLMFDSFSGPSLTIGGEVVANNEYTVAYDLTINGGMPGWRLTPGQSSGAVMGPVYKVPQPAYKNPAGIAPYNYMVGIPASSGISLPEYGGHQPCFLDANCFYFGQAYQWLSNDATMTTQQTVTAVANDGGKIRITAGSLAGLSNNDPLTVSLVGGVPGATGLWKAGSVSGASVTLLGWNGAPDSVYAAGFTSGGLVTYGQLDTAIYHLLDSVVVARTPLFNDSLGFYGWQSQEVTPGIYAVAPMALVTSFIVDANTSQTGAQGRISLTVASNFAGGKNQGNVLTLGQGVIATGCGGEFPNGTAPTSSAGWIAQDLGHGTVNATAYYARSLILPAPHDGDGSNVVLQQASGTTARVTADSLTVRGPDTTASCGKQSAPVYTTLRTIDKTVNFAAMNGAGALDVGSIAANTPYAVFIIMKSSDGTVNILASLSATAPTMPSGYDTKAFVGWVQTAAGAATLLTSVQNGSSRPFFIITGATTLNASAFPNGVVQAGGNADYNVSVGAASGFPNGAVIIVDNVDTANTKNLIVTGLTAGTTIAAQSSFVIRNINNAWAAESALTGVIPVGTSGGVLCYTATNTTASSSALTSGQVVIGGGAGVCPSTPGGFGLTSGNVLINTTQNYGGRLVVNNNAGTLSKPSTAIGIYNIGVDGTASQYVQDTYGAASVNFTGRIAAGSGASPTALSANSNTWNLVGQAYGATSFATIGAITIRTAENQTDTAHGGKIWFATVPNGTTTNTNRWEIADTGHINPLADAAYDFGTLGTARVRNYYGSGLVQTGTVAVGSLPTCNGTSEGTRYAVTDSNAASFTAGIGAVVAAGGTTHVPVFCDGTSWRIGANDNFPQLKKVA